MLKHILPLIPEHRCYCEVFGGGLAVFLAKPESPVEVVNDINGDLVTFYRICKYHLDPLQDELDLVANSRRDFNDYLQQPGLTDIQRAARWFIRNKLSFGGMGKTFAITRTQPFPQRSKRLLAIRALNHRFNQTSIENLSWEKCLSHYDDTGTFFFLDPPYLDGAGAAYDGWSELELARFAQRVRELEGKWMVTFQDCEQVRDNFSGFQIRAIERANGIGNRGGKKGRVYREVIITNERDEFTRARKERGA